MSIDWRIEKVAVLLVPDWAMMLIASIIACCCVIDGFSKLYATCPWSWEIQMIF
jgi:hypothetical protein